MMNKEQKEQITRLMKELEKDKTTSSIVGFIADNNGMLGACRELVKNYETGDTKSKEWLTAKSKELEISIHLIIVKIKDIVTLLSSESVVDEAYATLGVSIDADLEEVKRAYRKLSLDYHPDTTVQEKDYNPDKFIQITKAYHAITDSNGIDRHIISNRVTPTWKQRKKRSVSQTQRNKVYLWATALVIGLLVVSILSAVNYRKNTMIAALQNSRGAFIPPSTKKNISFSAPYISHEPTENVQISQYIDNLQQDQGNGDPKSKYDDRKSENVKEERATNDKFAYKVSDIPESISPTLQIKNQSDEPIAEYSVESSSSDKVVTLTRKFNIKRPVSLPDQESNLINKEDQLSVVIAITEPIEQKEAVIVEDPTQQNNISDEDRNFKRQSTSEELAGRRKQYPEAHKTVPADRLLDNQELSQPDKNSYSLTSDKSRFTKHERRAQSHLPIIEKQERPASNDDSEADILVVNDLAKIQSLKQRVDKFLLDYVNAYNLMNIGNFTTYFTDEALENNQPFTKKKSVYSELFGSTSLVNIEINDRAQRKEGEIIIVEGKFKVLLQYKDDRKLSGEGPIKFELVERANSLKIKNLFYKFEK